MTETRAPDYTGFRFPPESTARAVWLYFRFALSYRDVEEVLAERGVIVTDETVCQWCRKVGQPYANTLRRRRPRPGDTWHLDEVFVTINGRLHYQGLGPRGRLHIKNGNPGSLEQATTASGSGTVPVQMSKASIGPTSCLSPISAQDDP